MGLMKKASKSITKNDSKTHSNNEVKRYVGAITEEFKHGLSAIGEQFGGLNKKLDQHSKILDSHTKMIGSLMMDVSVLKSDMTVVKEDVSILKKDVKIIKDDLKQKVDRLEFETLTHKVSVVEKMTQ